MQCSKCKRSAVLLNPRYCKAHFMSYFEGKVLSTIRKYRLCSPKDRICVAASGGKDSTVLLSLLAQHFPHVSCLAIDEGIRGYRDTSLEDLRSFCTKRKITLRIVSFSGYAQQLDQLVTRFKHPCSVCGVLRRYLLNRHAREYDVLATGHNLDDEAQAVLMNLFTNNLSHIPRSYPVSAATSKFVRKVKPLYFCTEKEVMLYAVLAGIAPRFCECPYMRDSFRNTVRDSLNNYERDHPGTKLAIVRKAHSLRSKLRFDHTEQRDCENCGEPSHGELCAACRIIAQAC